MTFTPNSKLPKKTAPPSEIHIVLGKTPLKSPRIPSVWEMCRSVGRNFWFTPDSAAVAPATPAASATVVPWEAALRSTSMRRVLTTSSGVVKAAEMPPAKDPTSAAWYVGRDLDGVGRLAL